MQGAMDVACTYMQGAMDVACRFSRYRYMEGAISRVSVYWPLENPEHLQDMAS